MTSKTGEELAIEGAQLAVERAQAIEPEWVEHVRACIHILAMSPDPFTSEDVLHMAGRPMISDPRAMGAIMRQAKTEGRIEPTGLYVRAQRPSRHSGVVRQWRGKS